MSLWWRFARRSSRLLGQCTHTLAVVGDRSLSENRIMRRTLLVSFSCLLIRCHNTIGEIVGFGIICINCYRAYPQVSRCCPHTLHSMMKPQEGQPCSEPSLATSSALVYEKTTLRLGLPLFDLNCQFTDDTVSRLLSPMSF